MNNIDKHLAGIALFGILYDSKKNILDIIATFTKDCIIQLSLHDFALEDITNKVNNFYGFNIPSAVYQKALKRIPQISRSNQKFIVGKIDNTDICILRKQEEIITDSYNLILEKLYLFIQTKKSIALTSDEKKIINHNLSNFLVNKSNGKEFVEYITTFLIENKDDPNIKQHICTLREGSIIHAGIRLDDSVSNNKWNTKLTIFLDTEIIFHLMGYNGELFQKLAQELFDQIKEINKGEKLISLLYFSEIKNEIDSFFYVAEKIVSKEIRQYKHPLAMSTITNGCKTPMDVVKKKTDLFDYLLKEGIKEDNFSNYYSDYNKRYNIISIDEFESIQNINNKDKSSNTAKDDTSLLNTLNCLNYVAIRRGEGKYNNFENIKYIFLTGSSETISISTKRLKSDKEVPFATDMGFLTSKFWFKLNKGLGNPNLSNFDIIVRSQITLSKILQDSISNKYDNLKQKFNDKTIDQQGLVSYYGRLRESNRKPEDINSINVVEDVLSFITEDDIDKHLEQQAHLKNKNEELEKDRIELSKTISEKNEYEKQLLINIKETKSKSKIDKQSIIDSITKNRDENQKKLDSFNISLKEIEEKKSKKANVYIISIGILALLIIIAISFIIILKEEFIIQYFNIPTNYYNAFKLLIPIILAISPIIFLWIKGKSFNLNKGIIWLKSIFINKVTYKYIEAYNKLEKEIDILEIELKNDLEKVNKVKVEINDINEEILNIELEIQNLYIKE